jgi:hypothetical protein
MRVAPQIGTNTVYQFGGEVLPCSRASSTRIRRVLSHWAEAMIIGSGQRAGACVCIIIGLWRRDECTAYRVSYAVIRTPAYKVSYSANFSTAADSGPS